MCPVEMQCAYSGVAIFMVRSNALGTRNERGQVRILSVCSNDYSDLYPKILVIR